MYAPPPPPPPLPTTKEPLSTLSSSAGSTWSSSDVSTVSSASTVDHTIAQRRAELRRLQSKAKPIAGPIHSFSSREKEAGSTAVSSSSTASASGGISAELQGRASVVAVARRLETSYPSLDRNGLLDAKMDVEGVPPPSASTESHSEKNGYHFKRSSEIFNHGQKKNLDSGISTHSQYAPKEFSMSSNNSRYAPMSSREPPHHASSSTSAPTILAPSSSRSPFGAARATLVPVLSFTAGGVGPPPLNSSMLEPPLVVDVSAEADIQATINGAENGKKSLGLSDAPRVTGVKPTEGRPPKSDRTGRMLKSVENDISKSISVDVDANRTSPTPTNIAGSGESTPITSNVTASATAKDAVRSALGEAKQSLMKSQQEKKISADAVTAETSTITQEEVEAEAEAISLSHLQTDLLRTKREKDEALQQVAALQELVSRMKHATESTVTANSCSPLLERFQEMVASKGEKVVTAWISQQLKKGPVASKVSPLLTGANVSSTPRGRSVASCVDLLATIVPPVTPRGRIGSRSTSPERGGFLIPHSLVDSKNIPARVARLATPMPKLLNDSKGSSGRDCTVIDKIEEKFSVAAANIIPNDYGTQLAEYIVRRPSSVENPDEDVNFSIYQQYFSSSDSYRQSFDVYNPDSLEVLAYIGADGSVFILTGNSNARHGKNLPSTNNAAGNYGGSFSDDDNEYSNQHSLHWDVFDNVEEMDGALGSVSYIDVEGNEREYWLDSVYEEALTIREAYRTSIISAAYALQHSAMESIVLKPSTQSEHFIQPEPQAMPSKSLISPIIPTPDHESNGKFSVKLEKSEESEKDFNLNPDEQLAATVDTFVEETHSDKQKPLEAPSIEREETSKLQLPEEYESADSALPYLVISLFSLLFSILWFFFVKLPYKAFSTVLTLCITVAMLRIFWLILADDNGAWDIGAGVEYEFNVPGIH